MRKNLVMLLTLMFVIAIPCALVQGTQAITLDKTYSDFGFSFKYPKGMWLSESGLFEARANDVSGVITGEFEDQLLTVGWMKMESGIFDLESSLAGGLSGMKEAEGITNFVEGEKGETIANGHKVVYQFFSFSAEGEPFYGIFSVWYCDVSEKIYLLSTMSIEKDNFPLFVDYLGSFVCHQAQVPTPAAESKFELSSLSIGPGSVEKGEAVTIKVDVTNNGKVDGSTIINLKIKDTIVDSREVTINAGETKSIKFIHVAEDETGTYVVEVDGEVGSYEVTPGFEAIFAIMGLLAVACLLRSRK